MPNLNIYLLLGVVGIIPSLVWLAVYLRKDCHPEPKYLVVKTFLMGIIVAPLVLLFQLLFIEICDCRIQTSSPAFFLWGSFVEELFKFYAVRLVALRNANFDEPVDAMIYMIVAALGFAAMENIIYLSRTVQQGISLNYTATEQFNAVLAVWTLRFAGATLLHALSSALLGYFIALSWFFRQHARNLIIGGVLLATMFHFTFNLFVSLPGDQQFFALVSSLMLLGAMAFLVSVLFDKIKERHLRTVVLT